MLKLEFIGNNIDIFTGKSLATINKEYSLQIDGNLTPFYTKEKENIDIIKKQPVELKYNSLINMISSGEKQEIFEGLSQLVSFVSTKRSLPFHARIVEVLYEYIQTGDQEVFDIVWKIIRGILKKTTSSTNIKNS